MSSNNTYPATNAQLYTNSQYNFTSGVRNEANLGQTWDSANLLIGDPSGTINNVTQTPLGTYNATYSFTNDRAGGLAADFAYSFGTSASAQVLDSYIGHRKVLQQTGGTSETIISNTFAAQSSGNISLWFCVSSITAFSEPIRMVGENPRLAVTTSTFQYYNGGWVTITGITPVANRWYYLEWGFETTGNTFSITIDGVERAVFVNAFTTLTQYGFVTGSTAGTIITIDALDYSWTPFFSLKRAAIDLGQVGIYNATYSFENDTMFAKPTGISNGFTEDSAGDLRVYPQIPTATSYHRNVQRVRCDASGSSSYFANFTATANPVTNIRASFWYYTMAFAAGDELFTGYRNGIFCPTFHVLASTYVMEYYSGAGWVAITTLSANTWYYLDFNFLGATRKWDLRVNGMLKASQLGWRTDTTPTSLNAFQFYAGGGAEYFIDGVDFSTDPAYYTERSTYMYLNSTSTFPVAGTMLSFPVAGAYSYKWQAWASGICYDQNPPVPFTVQENVQLISESTATTRWAFTDYSTGSYTSLYTATFGTYSLTVASSREIYYTQSVTQDATASDFYASTNYGSSTYAGVQLSDGMPIAYKTFDDPVQTVFDPVTMYAYFGVDTSSSYLTYNITARSLVYYWEHYVTHNPTGVSAYVTTSFDESTLTWNTKPATGALISSVGTISDGWNSIVVPTSTSWVTFQDTVTEPKLGRPRTSESIYPPYFTSWIGKMYSTAILAAIQTNTTETLVLSSPTLTPLSLQANDRIRVTFSTTSTKEIKMLLSNGGTTVKTYEGSSALVQQPNSNYATQTKTFTITDASLAINGINFTGEFDDTKNLQVTSIVIERPSFPSYPYYVNPQGMVNIPFVTGTFGLTIYDMGGLPLWDTNTTIVPYVLNTIVYSPTTGGERQINFYNQRNELLDFATFRTVLNRTLNGQSNPVNPDAPYYMRSNRFYADIGSYYNMTVFDRFGTSLLPTNRTNAPIETFIDVQLTVYRLKVKNMAEKFCYLNISRDPDVGVYWSEWIAPGEIIAYDLYPNDYTVEIVNQENSSTQYYGYTLSGDDFLLIGSQNTIAQAIWNIQNTNATLGNQITAVNITISNQNTAINNSIVMVDINLSNINSTLGNQLISLDASITSVNNTIGVNFIATNTSIYEIGNWVNTSYSLLTAQVYQVNNSIYTAINVLDASLVSVNNSMNASFTTLIVKNDYLTHIFQHAEFSNLLNWTTSYNITNDLYWTSMLNVARNTSLDILLRYLNETDTIRVGAMETAYRYIPKGAEYRVWSVATGTYLTEWTPLADNATGTNNTAMLDFGSWQEPVLAPDAPQTWWESLMPVIGYVLIAVAVIIAIGLVVRDNKRKLLRARGYSESEAKHHGGR